MTDERQPWWASTDAGRTTTEDPVEAHRAARRGSGAPGGDPTGPADDPVDPGAGADRGATGERSPGSPGSPSGHAEAVCGVCPICVLARTLGDTHPELLGHLTEAARHLAAAARSMLESSPSEDPGSEGVQRIDLD